MVRRASCKLMAISTLAIIMTSMGRDVLLMNEELKTGESLDVGDYKLLMQDHCNLALYDKQAAVWTSNSAVPDKTGCKARLRVFGNLEIRDPTGYLYYNSKSEYCCGDFVLVLQEDRNVVLYGTSIWATGTEKNMVGGVVVTATGTQKNKVVVTPMNRPMLASTSTPRDVLLSGQVLKTGDSLNAGDYRLVMEEHCNLIMYDQERPIWISNAGDQGKTGCLAEFTNYGFLAIYDRNGDRVYASNSAEKRGNYVLVLQKDRNLVIYGPSVWATNTQINKVGGVVVTAINGTVDDGGSTSSSRIGRKIWLQSATALGDVHEQLKLAAA